MGQILLSNTKAKQLNCFEKVIQMIRFYLVQHVHLTEMFHNDGLNLVALYCINGSLLVCRLIIAKLLIYAYCTEKIEELVLNRSYKG